MSMSWLKQYLLRQKHKVSPISPLKKVVVEGCKLGFVDPTVAGSVQMTGQPSSYASVDDKGVYDDSSEFTVAAGSISAGCRLSQPIVDTFKPSALYCLVDKITGRKPVRENDVKVVTGAGNMATFPFFPCTFVATVKVVDANQDSTEMS